MVRGREHPPGQEAEESHLIVASDSETWPPLPGFEVTVEQYPFRVILPARMPRYVCVSMELFNENRDERIVTMEGSDIFFIGTDRTIRFRMVAIDGARRLALCRLVE